MTSNVAVLRAPRYLRSPAALRSGCGSDAAPWVVVLGVASLVGFALALTRVDSTFAGRAFAAYGGIYIDASLVWLWVVERQVPTRTDLLGATLAIIGALVIIGFAGRARWLRAFGVSSLHLNGSGAWFSLRSCGIPEYTHWFDRYQRTSRTFADDMLTAMQEDSMFFFKKSSGAVPSSPRPAELRADRGAPGQLVR